MVTRPVTRPTTTAKPLAMPRSGTSLGTDCEPISTSGVHPSRYHWPKRRRISACPGAAKRTPMRRTSATNPMTPPRPPGKLIGPPPMARTAHTYSYVPGTTRPCASLPRPEVARPPRLQAGLTRIRALLDHRGPGASPEHAQRHSAGSRGPGRAAQTLAAGVPSRR